MRGVLSLFAGRAEYPMWRLLVVGLGTLVVPLDTAVNVDFPQIVRRFDLPLPMIQWVVISYVLTQTSLLLSFGRIGDMLGYRRVFLFGTAWSCLAFIACAFFTSFNGASGGSGTCMCIVLKAMPGRLIVTKGADFGHLSAEAVARKSEI